MKRIGLAEARDNLSSLVNDAAHGGHRIVIESRGRAKAAIVPMADLARLDEVGAASREVGSPMLRWLAETQRLLRRHPAIAAGSTLEALREVREGSVAESPGVYRRQRGTQAGRRRRR
ncbi:MAG: type II toxin-antitoxin system Phd/YefM family antitoxin [Deltaproteobacteria bacterium]|nr:type II toxin-antitoxin system Phd/YefM family antitoxin [Deltaproteobacteria bacterium]MBI3387800.1 type II toxin-antitoxin system Phd/YefM family antitoxin [Deltaproteobacteria bacterium]